MDKCRDSWDTESHTVCSGCIKSGFSMRCIQKCTYCQNLEGHRGTTSHVSQITISNISAHSHFRLKNLSHALTDSETLMEESSSAFFSRELTHILRFCLQREAAARFRSRKRCLLSSGSSSVVLRLRPPVG